MKCVLAYLLALLTLTSGACSEDDQSADASAEYADQLEMVFAAPFAATYELIGEGESPVRTGTISWRYHPELGQRFDVEFIEPSEDGESYTLVETATDRVICRPEDRICTQHITELQGSDFMAMALNLPVGSEWEFEPDHGVTNVSTDGRWRAFDDDVRGRCFEFTQSHADLTVVFVECFARGVVAYRYLSGTGEEESLSVEWTLSEDHALADASFLEPPYPIIDPD